MPVQADLGAMTSSDDPALTDAAQAATPMPPSIAGIMAEGLDPVAEITAASAFLQDLVPRTGPEIRFWLDGLPQHQAQSVRYQEPPNALLALQDPARVRPLPTAEKCLFMEGVARLFSADGSYAGPSDEGGIAELYFSLWLDEIFHRSAPHWAHDRDEAWEMFLFAAGMMADPGLRARITEHLPTDHVVLRGDLNPPVRVYENSEVMSSEIIGFVLDLLASPHLDAEHEVRMRVAMAIHNHERRWRGLGNFHGHGLIDAIHDGAGRRQTIFEALRRSGGMTEEGLLAAIREREGAFVSLLLPPHGGEFDEPEYYGAD